MRELKRYGVSAQYTRETYSHHLFELKKQMMQKLLEELEKDGMFEISTEEGMFDTTRISISLKVEKPASYGDPKWEQIKPKF